MLVHAWHSLWSAPKDPSDLSSERGRLGVSLSVLGWEDLALLDQGLEMDTGWDRPFGSMSLPCTSHLLPPSNSLTDVCLWLLSECKSQEGKYLWPLL